MFKVRTSSNANANADFITSLLIKCRLMSSFIINQILLSLAWGFNTLYNAAYLYRGYWDWRTGKNIMVTFCRESFGGIRHDEVLQRFSFEFSSLLWHGWLGHMNGIHYTVYTNLCHLPQKFSSRIGSSGTRMWANAQRDGRPAEYRWRPLFNATKFGWRPLLECRAVMLPRHETRWNLQGRPKLPDRSQPLVGRSSPYCGDMWRRYCCLTSFFSNCRYVP